VRAREVRPGQRCGWCIAGTAEDATRDPGCAPPQVFDFKPVLWGPRYGEIQELPTYPGDSIGATTATNDRGQVVGGSGTCGPPSFPAITHALLWQGGSRLDLGNHGGQFNNVPTAINNFGQVVGWSDLPGDTTTHAFLWQKGVMSDLGTLPGDASSTAMAINIKGQIAGSSCDPSGACRAFLWQDGKMTDLNAITDVNTSEGPFELVNANGINARGEIVGFGVYPSTDQGRAYAALPFGGLPASNQGFTGAPRAAHDARPHQAAPCTNRHRLLHRAPTLRLFGSRFMTPRSPTDPQSLRR
jgi:probable HAF family extracellular repeat protein